MEVASLAQIMKGRWGFREPALLILLFLLLAAPAAASDPGRWEYVGAEATPIRYFQGLAPDDQGNLYFNGVTEGVYRTTNGRETGGHYHIIPRAVRRREGYNHIGAIAFSAGRVLLPLECYYPLNGGKRRKRGRDENTCKTASIGVADRNLRWLYYVKLSGQEIRKAMWAQVSPDGQTLWTSSGGWLLGYRMADLAAANAAPRGPAVHPYRSLLSPLRPGHGSPGITGATFVGTRLLLAGSQGPYQRVWSIDTVTGATQLEIERTDRGESEGLAMYGGQLHWQVQPFSSAYHRRHPSRRRGLVLNFVPLDQSPYAPRTPAPAPTPRPCVNPFDRLLGLCRP